MSSHAHATGLTYDDLESLPDDGMRHELIGGELIVSPSPRARHQDVSFAFTMSLGRYAEEHGGKLFYAPFDVYFAHDDVVQPDVLFILAEHLDRIEDRFIHGAPDIVVEVSSPSSRHVDLVRKRTLYERYGVPEYWYADLDADAVYVFRLVGGAYGDPIVFKRGETLTPPLLPGFALSIDYLFDR